MSRATGNTLFAGLIGAWFAAGCSDPAVVAPAEVFVDVTQERGLGARYPVPPEPTHLMPDIMAAGCALVDFDGDGDLDVFAVGGRGPDGDAGGNRLFRQEPGGTFTDVTAAAGVADTGFGMGVACGDYDGDGFTDLFVTAYGPDRLLRNRGDGTFEDVSAAAGVGDEGWGTSAGFFDYDADGWLDLFVVRYVELDSEEPDVDAAGQPEYPAPARFQGTTDRLYRNEGGRFRDVSETSGIGAERGRGLGVLLADLNGDARPDVYVANDGEPNFAWVQEEPGVFVDRASALGLAVNLFGQTEASMGVDRGDVDGDGVPDLFVSHLATETHTLYKGQSGTRYRDATTQSRLGLMSQGYTGFGAAFGDYDLDGDLDLICVNGRVLHEGEASVPGLDAHYAPYAQPNQLFLGDGAGTFAAAMGCGALCADVEVSRGLSIGDVDGDGDLDALVRNANGTLRLYLNASPPAPWLVVRAVTAGRDALGARVEVRAGNAIFRRDVVATKSYMSSSDPRAHFGLAGLGSIDSIRVHWPGGPTETFEGGPANRVRVLVEGEGRTER
ncbi:MAG: CRTAC1 family protein [bacterium]|nr:CRTAC1 family protein [bacterium]